MFQLKRIYDPPAETDGYRVLVDRLWPRGISKEAAKLDRWMKEIAPSAELRKWFCHDPGKWAEFTQLYLQELEAKKDQLIEVKKFEKERGNVTLLFAAKDLEHSQAAVLRDVLEKISPIK